jgi:AcrR family transcriptional regulator
MSRSAMTCKPPQQRRCQESLERILDAAETLIRERGFESMTIADVVQRSGSSVGSLYARFRDKPALLQAVQVRYHARVENAIAAAFDGDSPPDESLEDAARRIVRVLCDYLLNEPELFRAFILQAVFDDRVRGQGEAANSKWRDRVAAVLMTHREEIRHPDPDVAVRWFYSICMAMLRERITFGQAAELSGGFADEKMISELTRAVTSYLICDGPGERGAVDYWNDVSVLAPSTYASVQKAHGVEAAQRGWFGSPSSDSR